MPELKWEIVEYPGCLKSCVWGWREIFERARKRGEPVKHGRILLIPAYSGSSLPPVSDHSILKRLRKAHESGAVVASVCAGSAWIAAAGLDGGRTLTTHWSLASRLAGLRPDITVAATELVIDHGDIISAGGLLAWVDLGLHVVERYWGRRVADDCARVLVWDRGRKRQTPYFPLGSAWVPLRADPVLDAAVAWISARYLRTTRVEDWASAAALSARSLQRRWAAAFGLSPMAWLRLARIGEARRLLAESDASWESITRDCGYEDPVSFRRLFERAVGWTPGRYRATFRREASERMDASRASERFSST